MFEWLRIKSLNPTLLLVYDTYSDWVRDKSVFRIHLSTTSEKLNILWLAGNVFHHFFFFGCELPRFPRFVVERIAKKKNDFTNGLYADAFVGNSIEKGAKPATS